MDKSCSFGLSCVFREPTSSFVRASVPFVFEGGMWDLFVLVPAL